MNLDKYKFFDYVDKQGRHVVVAVSRHAGRIVKGYAKCSPDDEFNMETGKKLAAARCNMIVTARKEAAAEAKYAQAKDAYEKAFLEKTFRANKAMECQQDRLMAEVAISNILTDINHK